MRRTVIEHFNEVVPFEVRALARRNGRKITLEQIVKASGLTPKAVAFISSMDSWARIRIEDAQSFCSACGHDLLRPRRSLQYVMRFARTGRGFRHLNDKDKARLSTRLINLRSEQ